MYPKSDINNKTYWRILIGIAQSDMKWYYTEEELKEMMKKTIDKK
jgi:hypothetical protein